MSKIATKADKIEVEKVVHLLADTISPMYAEIAPASYQNMTGMSYKYFYRAFYSIRLKVAAKFFNIIYTYLK